MSDQSIIPQSLRPKLSEGDNVLICSHIYEWKFSYPTHYRKAGEFTREDGTTGKVEFCIICNGCRNKQPKEIAFLEFFWAEEQLHCADTHLGVHN